MGANLVTTPYKADIEKNASEVNTNNSSSFSQTSNATQTQSSVPSHPHQQQINSINYAEIPSGCPMHQAQNEKNKNATNISNESTNKMLSSGCPMSENDINPTNMVSFHLKHLCELTIII
jgi:hypothetical protein